MWEYKYTGQEASLFNKMTAEIITGHVKDVESSIELGAGTGQLSLLLTMHYKNFVPTLIDNSESAIEYIEKYYFINGLTKDADYTLSKRNLYDMQYLPLYDIAMSSGLIEHMRGPVLKLICHMHKKLSKKYVIIVVPNATKENTEAAKTKAHIDRYGHEYPMSAEELDKLIINDQWIKVHSETYYKNDKLLIGIYERTSK